MSACDTSIDITGLIDDAAALDKLVAAIVADRPTPGWSDEAIARPEEAIDYIRASVAAGENLVFAENERDGESFPRIEAACREIGLGYVRTVSVDEAFDTAGSRTIYDPKVGKAVELAGVDNGSVDAQPILALLDAGKIEEAKERLRYAIAPEKDLPDEFCVADGLLAEPAMRP